MQLTLTSLLMTAVVEVMDNYRRGYIRCAGTVGAAVIDEAVCRGVIPVAADVDGYGYDIGTWAPVNVYEYSGAGIWKVQVSLHALAHDEHYHLASPSYGTVSILREMNTDFWRGLQSIELTHSNRLRWLSPNWLAENENLEELIIPPHSMLMTMQEAFLKDCKMLRHVDLSFMRLVTHISERFLEGCTSLQSVDFSPLRHLSKVGPNFMFGCTSITTIDLAPFHRLADIPPGFLSGCTALQEIDLGPFKDGVSRVAWDFLSQCSSLTEIDLSPLNDVSRIGSSFLAGCTGLKRVDTSTGMGTIRQTCGWKFLSRSENLEEVNLAALMGISQLGWDFLSWCPRLVSINLSPLINVTSIGESFLQGCSSLREVDILPLSNTVEIGGRFMAGCSSITILDISPLRNVPAINQGFLEGCSSLEVLDVTVLVNVKNVARNFLNGCVALKEIDVRMWLVASQISGGGREVPMPPTIAGENFANGVHRILGLEEIGMMFVSSSDYLQHVAEEDDEAHMMYPDEIYDDDEDDDDPSDGSN